MFLALLTLVAATWAGLLRLGWQWPTLRPTLALSHGPLMVAGFFGTLISLERVVAMGKRWTYIGPLVNGIGGVLFAFGIGGIIGPVLITLGSIWLILIFRWGYRVANSSTVATILSTNTSLCLRPAWDKFFSR